MSIGLFILTLAGLIYLWPADDMRDDPGSYPSHDSHGAATLADRAQIWLFLAALVAASVTAGWILRGWA